MLHGESFHHRFVLLLIKPQPGRKHMIKVKHKEVHGGSKYVLDLQRSFPKTLFANKFDNTHMWFDWMGLSCHISVNWGKFIFAEQNYTL